MSNGKEISKPLSRNNSLGRTTPRPSTASLQRNSVSQIGTPEKQKRRSTLMDIPSDHESLASSSETLQKSGRKPEDTKQIGSKINNSSAVTKRKSVPATTASTEQTSQRNLKNRKSLSPKPSSPTLLSSPKSK